MKTRNFLIAVLFFSGLLAFTSCQKDNSLQPESNDAAMKSHQTGEIWQIEVDPLTNFPDPFVDETTIEYRLNKAGYVRLTVSGENSHSITILVSGYKEAGVYQFKFDGSQLEPGIYIAQLRHNGVFVKEVMQKIPKAAQALDAAYQTN